MGFSHGPFFTRRVHGQPSRSAHGLFSILYFQARKSRPPPEAIEPKIIEAILLFSLHHRSLIRKRRYCFLTFFWKMSISTITIIERFAISNRIPAGVKGTKKFYFFSLVRRIVSFTLWNQRLTHHPERFLSKSYINNFPDCKIQISKSIIRNGNFNIDLSLHRLKIN